MVGDGRDLCGSSSPTLNWKLLQYCKALTTQSGFRRSLSFLIVEL